MRQVGGRPPGGDRGRQRPEVGPVRPRRGGPGAGGGLVHPAEDPVRRRLVDQGRRGHRADQGRPAQPSRRGRAGARRRGRPAVAVAIVPNSPRISDGASGLGSNVSSWLMPPVQKARITPRTGRLAAGDSRRTPAFARRHPVRGRASIPPRARTPVGGRRGRRRGRSWWDTRSWDGVVRGRLVEPEGIALYRSFKDIRSPPGRQTGRTRPCPGWHGGCRPVLASAAGSACTSPPPTHLTQLSLHAAMGRTLPP